MALKMWGLNDPVNHNDLNLNFVDIDLRILTLQQQVAALLAGGVISPGVALLFSDGTAATFSDNSAILLSS